MIGLYNYWVVIFLMMTGFYIVIARENLIKTIIGLNIFQTSVFLLYITMGKVTGGTAPIIQPGNGGDSHHDSHDSHRTDHGHEKGHGEKAHGEAAHGTDSHGTGSHGEEAHGDGAHESIESGADHASSTLDGLVQTVSHTDDPATTESVSHAIETVGGVGHAADQATGVLDAAHPAVYHGVTYSNPLPSVLMLTAIVVGIATTALALALIVRIREEYGTIEEDEILLLDREAGEIS